MSPKKRVLITGVSGLLGGNLAYHFRDHYEVLGWYHSHPVSIDNVVTESVDLMDSRAVRESVARFGPDVAIHCASLTDLDFCELHKDLTFRINSLGTRILAESLPESKGKFIYISTDQVYDGQKGNYAETDPVNPQNVYGESKYQGELEALKRTGTLALRTNIFGWNIQEKFSLAEWVLNSLLKGETVRGFQDAIFSTIYTFELAKILDAVIEKNLEGTFNCGSRLPLTKFEFARRVAERFGLEPAGVTPIGIDEFPFKARRGKNLSLNVRKLVSNLNSELPAIDQSIGAFHRDFKNGFPDRFKWKSGLSSQYPRLPSIPYGRQCIEEDDIEAVIAVLKSPNLTQGPKVPEFESALCQLTGAHYAVAVNSGTSALHLACLAAGLAPGSEAITSPNTFVASANCIVYCGGKPVFADMNPQTYNVSPPEIDKRINNRTKAIIPVHFAGQSCDMETLQQISRTHERKLGRRIYLIEDASHALGSLYKGRQVGCCQFSDMAVMSFHPVKHVTTGEGGVVLTNDGDLYKKLRRLRSHGITSDPSELTLLKSSEKKFVPPWYYEQLDLGYNYRLTDIQGALGLSQLRKLPSFVRRRREIVSYYNTHFGKRGGVQIPHEFSDGVSNFHLYVLLIDFESIGMDRQNFMTLLRERGIFTQVHYIPVHLQPFYRQHFQTKPGDCPHAEEYYSKCLSIPLYPAMSDLAVLKVITEVEELLGNPALQIAESMG